MTDDARPSEDRDRRYLEGYDGLEDGWWVRESDDARPSEDRLRDLPAEWERDAARRSSDPDRRDDPANLLAAGVLRRCASDLRAALAASRPLGPMEKRL